MSMEARTAIRLLEDALRRSADGFLVVDREGRVVYFNEGCARITGWAFEAGGASGDGPRPCEAEDPASRTLDALVRPVQSLVDGHADVVRQRLTLEGTDGRRFSVDAVYSPLRTDGGTVEFVVAMLRRVPMEEAAAGPIPPLAELGRQVRALAERQRARFGFDNIVARSPLMLPVFRKVRAALGNWSAVLISGESGTGKEVVARTIHDHSRNREGPFVPLNCSALPRDLIESELFGHVKGAFTGATQDYKGMLRAAEGGTIFLDEIGAMPLETQAKLLRVLQDKRVRPVGSTVESPVNVRVIAATNRPPREAIGAGRLREDLFYRLSVIAIDLPPLCRRSEDIPLLVQTFIDEFNRTSDRQVADVSPAAWRALLGYSWPGNVRELSNVVESAFALGEGPTLEWEDLPPEVQGLAPPAVASGSAKGLRLDQLMARAEREAILRALEAAKGRRSKAADLMGISRSRLYRRMDALGVDPDERA